MKSFRRLSWGYFVALAAMVLISASAQAAAIQNSGTVRAIRGKAQISDNKGQTWKDARVGAKVKQNTVIKTDPDSTVDVFLGENGPVVRITPGTQMGIDNLSLENTGIEKVIETQLDLKNGRILGSVKKMAAASKYEVKTPVGVAGIRGTEYSVDARGRVSIITGSAVVVYIVNGVVIPPVNVGPGQTATPPADPNGTPLIAPTGTPDPGFDTLLQGITIDPDGNIIVEVITPDPDGTIAPGPDQTVQPNPNIIQGDLSPTEPGSGNDNGS